MDRIGIIAAARPHWRRKLGVVRYVVWWLNLDDEALRFARRFEQAHLESKPNKQELEWWQAKQLKALEIELNEKYGSITVMILMAVASAVIKIMIERWLDS